MHLLQRTGHAAARHPAAALDPAAAGGAARHEVFIFGGFGPTPTSRSVNEFSQELVILDTKKCHTASLGFLFLTHARTCVHACNRGRICALVNAVCISMLLHLCPYAFYPHAACHRRILSTASLLKNLYRDDTFEIGVASCSSRMMAG